jgi:hypothetical protein
MLVPKQGHFMCGATDTNPPVASCAAPLSRLLVQVNAAGTRTCRESEDAELKPACAASCRDACRDGLAVYASESSALSGFKVQY